MKPNTLEEKIENRNARQRRYWQRNKERLLAKKKEWREANRELHNQRAREWARTHPEVRRKKEMNYRHKRPFALDVVRLQSQNKNFRRHCDE